MQYGSIVLLRNAEALRIAWYGITRCKRREEIEMDRELLEKFFFKAMRHVCGLGPEKMMPSVNGRPQIIFRDDFFRFEEQYDMSPDASLRLDGRQEIFFQGEFEPVWAMDYVGSWRKEDIPFLNRALLKEYQDEHFTGGRGPNHYQEGRFTYENRTFPANIDRSCGHEKVYEKEGELFKIRGHYTYFGGTSENFRMQIVA